MDNIPQYVRDFLNNYYELTRRLIDVIDSPTNIVIHNENTGHDKFYKSTFSSIGNRLYYDIYDNEYLYWWKGLNGVSLNLTLGNLLISGANNLLFYERKGIINDDSIYRVNELLDMGDEEFTLYIKVMGIVYDTGCRINIYQ